MAEAHHGTRRPSIDSTSLRGHIAATALVSSLAAPAAFAMPVLGYTELNIIGDSLSDQGRFAAINEAEGGPGIPPRYNPVSGRFTSSLVWADLLQADNPGLQVNNRALGGAFINDAQIPGFGLADNAADVDTGTPQPALDGVQSQLAAIDTIAADATNVLWAGANDIVFIGAPGVGGGQTTPEAFIGGLIAGISGSIDQLIAKGATPEFIYVGNVPTLGLTPLGGAGGEEAAALFTGLSDAFNQGLAGVAAAKGVNVLDFATATEELIANPDALGLLDVTTPCATEAGVCANPDERFFWDTLHPTTVVHGVIRDIIADATARVTVETPAPMTALLVAGGLLGLGATRRRR